MSELNIGGGNMTVELRDNTLCAEANTGNKQWVAILTDTHPQYNYDRDFVAYQKPKTTNRDSGTATVEDGAVIERVRYTHSGKNRTDQYYQLVGGEAHEIDESDVVDAINGEIIPDVEDDDDDGEPAVCEDCGAECASEHGLAVHKGIAHSEDDEEGGEEEKGEAEEEDAPTADPATSTDSPAILADGGEEIRAYRDVRHSDDEVRHYSADGTLYAYRDGDDHVVVSRGREPRDKWTERVPATRNAVVQGEHLWTVPDNWERKFRISGPAEAAYAIYTIPETGVDVLVTVPNKNFLVDAWYGVKTVGQLDFEFDGVLDREALTNAISECEGHDDIPADLLDALKTMEKRWSRFERKYLEDYDTWAEEAFWHSVGDDGRVTLDGWSIDPWQDIYDIIHYVMDICDIERDLAAEVSEVMREADAVSYYPNVRVTVRERAGLPDGYDVRALIEAGCSPAETVDYMMTEILGESAILGESQSSWGETREKDQSTISGNVSQARRTLER